MQPHTKHRHTSLVLHVGSHTFGSVLRLGKVWRMGKSVHLFATIALSLLFSVGTLLLLPIGPAQGAATLPQGFTDSQVVSGLEAPSIGE